MALFSKDKLRAIKQKKKSPKVHTILVVDDEPANLKIFSDLLSDFYWVLTASDGAAALKLIKDDPDPLRIHLIISDQRMPNMTGLALLESSMEIIPRAIRIIITGFTDFEVIINSINKVSIFQFLVKPIDNRSLLVLVKRALETYDLREKNRLLVDELSGVNEELRSLNTELEHKVEERTTELRYKNGQLLSSLSYAKHIQDSILPDPDRIKALLPSSFILFKPRDLVSGDFYWVSRRDGATFVAAIDCTGHGVPGAFLSIIGNNLLNMIIKDHGLRSPAAILERMDEGVHETLRQDRGASYADDGMDVGLCRLDPENGQITFAGAKRPLYIVSQGEEGGLSEIKGDRRSVGGRKRKTEPAFTDQVVTVGAEDTIYLTSDGFADQPGAQKSKYGVRQLKDFLISLQDHAMECREEVLRLELRNFQTDLHQRDDITIIGFNLR